MRVSINVAAINPERYGSTSYDTHNPIEDMKSWRDEFRARFTAESVASQMKASDIFTWTGSSVYTGYGFVVKDNTNNTALYILTGGNHTTQPDLDDWLGSSGSIVRNHVTAVGVATVGSTSIQKNGVVMLFNPDTTTAEPDLDFDNTTDLTYTGGDGTALTTINPDSSAGLALLRPSHCTMGISFEEMFINGDGVYVPFAFCYDDELKAWRIQAEQGKNKAVRYECMFGEWIIPSGGDTNKVGTLKSKWTGSTAAAFGETHAKVYAFDAGGTERLYDLVADEDFDTSTYKVQSGANAGKIDWKVVDITNGSGGSGTKGTTDEEAIVECFPFDDGRFLDRPLEMPDSDHPVTKSTASLAFFWQDAYPLPNSWRKGTVH